MEINWLHDFIAVAATRSFSRAAEQRNSSQPALSRRIKALELWAGAALFERTTHAVSLTAAGEAFRLTALEGVPAAEVARRLGMSVGAVYQAACSVREKLSREVKALEGLD